MQLVLHQGGPERARRDAGARRADVAIATDALDNIPEFRDVPVWQLAPHASSYRPAIRSTASAGHDRGDRELPDHHLQRRHSPAAAASDEAFTKANLTPNIVMSALDADVIKAYVELGLGVGIVAAMAFNADRDKALRMVPSEHLFEASTTASRSGAAPISATSPAASCDSACRRSRTRTCEPRRKPTRSEDRPQPGDFLALETRWHPCGRRAAMTAGRSTSNAANLPAIGGKRR